MRCHLPFLGVVVVALAFSASGCSRERGDPPRAQDGRIDLREWDFTQGSVRLSGEWDFFPGELLSGPDAIATVSRSTRVLPDRWRGDVAGMSGGRGAGTYRLKVTLLDGIENLGLLYTTAATCLELEAISDAGAEIAASVGKPSIRPESAVSAYRPGVAALGPVSGELWLLFRVSNYEYREGGPWRPLYLGRVSTLERERWLSLVASIALASILAAVSVLFAFFIRAGTPGRGFAAFSLFALVSALRSLVTGQYGIVDLFPSISFDLVIRLEYLTAFSTYGVALVFFSVLFPEESHRRAERLLVAACAAFVCVVPFAPLRFLTSCITPFYALAAAIIVAIGAMIVRAVIRRRSGAFTLIAGGVILGGAAVNDILFASVGLGAANLFPAGMLVFVATQAYALADRYMIVQRRLREALADKEVLLREVHHRVKNGLQIVSSIASLEAHRAADSRTVAILENMRSRIRALSLVHERLYSLEGGSLVDAGAYISGLAGEISLSLGPGGGVVVEAESLMMPVEGSSSRRPCSA